MMSAAMSQPARRTKPKQLPHSTSCSRGSSVSTVEMPGLCVTAPQAERLWGLDSTTCAFALMTLIQRGVLKRTPNGTYVRG